MSLDKRTRNLNDRARHAGATGRLTTYEVRTLLSAMFCVYCGHAFADDTEKTVDHVEPLSKGGAHVVENLVVACGGCNQRKADATLDAFVGVGL
jgi:5-methylcytosine-specific restriction endonuclease McrA